VGAEPTIATRPLWTCPRCGASFVTRNMWHGCGSFTVDQFLEGKGPAARRLFDAFAELVRSCGPVVVVPTKSRVAFMVRVRFVGVLRVSRRGMTFSFGLMRPVESPRIARVDRYERWFVHQVRVTSPDELDGEVRGWLQEAYAVGQQRHLLDPTPAKPLTRTRTSG
jgi:uncharacterized protein DUF5655